MEDLKHSVVRSLDGSGIEIYAHLPYILQDLWAFGADPSVMLDLVRTGIEEKNPRILDLGCGKGAVSITIARELECTVKGIDAMPEFIESAERYARQFGVQDRCDFEVGDIRTKIRELKGFDVIILGAIGPVFGDLEATLRILAGSLRASGHVLLDDGYIPNGSRADHDPCLRRADFYGQIASAGFAIVREVIFTRETIEEDNRRIYGHLEKRIQELIASYPGKKAFFDAYLRSQEYENERLARELVTGTWLLRSGS